MQAISYYIIFVIIWLITLIPLRIMYGLSDFFYFILYYIIPYRKKLVFKNLSNAFPEMKKEERKKLAKKFYRHFCDNSLESVAILHMSANEMKKRFTILNPEVLDSYYKAGKHLIAVSGHYCTWDWFAGFPFYSNYTLIALYKPLHNKYYDRLFKNLREKFGSKTIASTHAVKVMMGYNGPPTLFWFIADQRPLRKDIRYWTIFFNQDTPIFLGVEKIARKTNFPVFFFQLRKVKRGYYTVNIIKLTDQPKELKEFELTERHVHMLEENIKEHPEYYLWSHNRWKHKKLDKDK